MFTYFPGLSEIFGQILRFLIKITWFLSFSNKNDSESFRNFIKNLVSDPKRATLVQKSYGKFMESLRNFQDLSRRTHKGPYGPIRAHKGPYGPIRAIWSHIWAHKGPYGPIKVLWRSSILYPNLICLIELGALWAHMGPYGSSWTGLGRLRKLSVNFP